MPTCEWVTLADGSRAFTANPSDPGPHPAVVIYIEAYGLNDHFQRLTQRFAAEGFHAITPDLYDGATYAYTDMPNAIAHLKRLDDAVVMERTRVALEHLGTSRVGVTGFCMGGRFAFLAAATHGDRFRCAAPFYGGGIGPAADMFGRTVPLSLASQLTCPLVLWYGGQDKIIRPDEHARIAEALGAAGKQYTMTVFPDATHGFFCEDRASYHAPSAERAWRGTLAAFRDYI